MKINNIDKKKEWLENHLFNNVKETLTFEENSFLNILNSPTIYFEKKSSIYNFLSDDKINLKIENFNNEIMNFFINIQSYIKENEWEKMDDQIKRFDFKNFKDDLEFLNGRENSFISNILKKYIFLRIDNNEKIKDTLEEINKFKEFLSNWKELIKINEFSKIIQENNLNRLFNQDEINFLFNGSIYELNTNEKLNDFSKKLNLLWYWKDVFSDQYWYWKIIFQYYNPLLIFIDPISWNVNENNVDNFKKIFIDFQKELKKEFNFLKEWNIINSNNDINNEKSIDDMLNEINSIDNVNKNSIQNELNKYINDLALWNNEILSKNIKEINSFLLEYVKHYNSWNILKDFLSNNIIEISTHYFNLIKKLSKEIFKKYIENLPNKWKDFEWDFEDLFKDFIENYYEKNKINKKISWKNPINKYFYEDISNNNWPYFIQEWKFTLKDLFEKKDFSYSRQSEEDFNFILNDKKIDLKDFINILQEKLWTLDDINSKLKKEKYNYFIEKFIRKFLDDKNYGKFLYHSSEDINKKIINMTNNYSEFYKKFKNFTVDEQKIMFNIILENIFWKNLIKLTNDYFVSDYSSSTWLREDSMIKFLTQLIYTWKDNKEFYDETFLLDFRKNIVKAWEKVDWSVLNLKEYIESITFAKNSNIDLKLTNEWLKILKENISKIFFETLK